MKKENVYLGMIAIIIFFAFILSLSQKSAVYLSPVQRENCSPIELKFCSFDLNNDAEINPEDAALITPNIGKSSDLENCKTYDLNSDGTINDEDRAELFKFLGKC